MYLCYSFLLLSLMASHQGIVLFRRYTFFEISLNLMNISSPRKKIGKIQPSVIIFLILR